jgi:hypothetical protein
MASMSAFVGAPMVVRERAVTKRGQFFVAANPNAAGPKKVEHAKRAAQRAARIRRTGPGLGLVAGATRIRAGSRLTAPRAPPQGSAAVGAQKLVGYKGSTLAGSAPTCVPRASARAGRTAGRARPSRAPRADAPLPARLGSGSTPAVPERRRLRRGARRRARHARR